MTDDFISSPGATIDFDATLTYARRAASKDVASFVPADHYTLQVIGTTTSLTRIGRVGLGFYGDVEIGVPLAIGSASRDHNGHVIAKGERIDLVVMGDKDGAFIHDLTIDRASATVRALPTSDGSPLSARVQIHFTNGEVFDGTISGELQSSCLCNAE